MSASDNVQRTRDDYAAFGRGDLDAIRENMSPDITWTVTGQSELAGTYRGIDEVFGYFGKLFEISGGTFRADLVECGEIADGLVAALVRLTGDMPGGSVDQRIVQLFREVDGKTVEVHNFPEDAYALDASIAATITLPGARTADQAAPITT